MKIKSQHKEKDIENKKKKDSNVDKIEEIANNILSIHTRTNS